MPNQQGFVSRISRTDLPGLRVSTRCWVGRRPALGLPQSVALANPNAVEWPYPVPDARDDLVNLDCCVFSVPKLRRSLLVDV